MVGALTFWVYAIIMTSGIAIAILVMVALLNIAGAGDRRFAPDENAIEHGSEYFCQIDRQGNGHSGEVWDVKHQVIRWKFDTRRNPSGRSRRNPLNKPDFVFADANGEDELVIRRAKFVPSVFQMLEKDRVIGQIRLCSIVQYKYAVEFEGASPWTFWLRLYTVRFWGGSDKVPCIWVVVGPSKMDWSILLKSELEHRRHAAALAFIHTEWWNYV